MLEAFGEGVEAEVAGPFDGPGRQAGPLVGVGHQGLGGGHEAGQVGEVAPVDARRDDLGRPGHAQHHGDGPGRHGLDDRDAEVLEAVGVGLGSSPSPVACQKTDARA